MMNEDKLGYSYSYDLKDGIVKVKDFVKYLESLPSDSTIRIQGISDDRPAVIDDNVYFEKVVGNWLSNLIHYLYDHQKLCGGYP